MEFLSSLPALNFGLGGTDGDARSDSGRAVTLGANRPQGLQFEHLLMLAVVGVVGVVAYRKVK